MSRNEDKKPGKASAALRAVEAFWHAELPEAFGALYSQIAAPFLAPCEFFTLDAIAGGAGRSFGLIPQFMPFGQAVGESGVYGFYVTPENIESFWPVLYWDEDEMYLRPVASDFETFIRHCLLVGRYESEDQDEEGRAWHARSEIREIARVCRLPETLLTAPIPRSDTELYERLVALDAQDAVSLCHVGCVRRARGDGERALDYFHRASESAPWFGDPGYLVADVYRERRNYARAVHGWWGVVQCLLPMCTRTWEWDLGDEHPEADIYEVAADGLAQHAEEADPALRALPLWQVIVHDDPYDPDVRESLGASLLAGGDIAGAEREFLNALSLCCSERGKQPDRLYDRLLSVYERQGRRRDAELARFDRTLPRSTV